MEDKPGKVPHILMSVDEFAKRFKVSSHETAPELKARLSREDADAVHERRKDWWLFVVVSSLTYLTALICLLVSVLPQLPPDDKKWANSLLATIITAALSYWAGTKSK